MTIRLDERNRSEPDLLVTSAALTTECQLPHGLPIVDEDGLRSTRWSRVRLPSGSAPPAAWLPAVRTKDRPPLPNCPRRE